MAKKSQEIKLLLHLLGEGYKKKAWHGPNLRGSLRGITPEAAAHRPASDRHNIWEIIVHCAYWKYVVVRRITGEQRDSFRLKGNNWFKRPVEISKEALQTDIALLDEMHTLLRETVAGLNEKDLVLIPKGSRVNVRETIAGIAMHDVYHAGQIQLLKKIQD